MTNPPEQSVASLRPEGATIKLRQGSILPKTVHDRFGLFELGDNADPVIIVISHDCDLVNQEEPAIELISGRSRDEFKAGFSNGQSPRMLHVGFEQNGKERVLELSALEKIDIRKSELIEVEPDPTAVLKKNGISILQGWLAARYKRAALPDELVRRMEPIKRHLRAVDSAAIVGIWMQYGPEDDNLPRDIPYELKIMIVYSTEVYEAKAKAEGKAKTLHEKFEEQFFAHGVWHSIDLRKCEAVADTVFSVRDLLEYKQWRLEHLSLREDPPNEYL